MAIDPSREGMTEKDTPTVTVKCGCCKDPFGVALGGSAYCSLCLRGREPHILARQLLNGG